MAMLKYGRSVTKRNNHARGMSMKNENIFYTTENLTVERFSWITELLKLYFTRHYPESLHHNPKTPIIPFSLFLSGDACYSLIDRRCAHNWEILFKLPNIRFFFDTHELMMRGISIEPYERRNPDHIISRESFADILLNAALQESKDSAFGFFQVQSPYMHASPFTMVRLFQAAIAKNISPEMYGYMDGVYTMHDGQKPTMCENFGDSLVQVSAEAVGKGLSPLFLMCSQSAASRGYSRYTTEKGKIISSCTIPPAKIRDLSHIISRFSKNHLILSHSALSIPVNRNPGIPEIRSPTNPDVPPLVILITRSPYGNEMAFGALTFAVACAHQGIHTRVVFIEDGIYALFGNHTLSESDPVLNIQSVIKVTSCSHNLEYYTYLPSINERGLSPGALMQGVQPVDALMLSQIFFQLPGGVSADRQRAILF
ncbi:MAG: DsrE family protein [Methanoregulaceae archaeon]|nr:DsrE family protein [Methanolinea sp.]MDD5048535.1 DsrE family protein [Methanoregulaceae archaeon]